MFKDRLDAAERMATALAACAGQRPLLLAIPRGGVPIAALLAQRLGGDLDLVLVRKLHAPGAPEFAIGAIDESGRTYLAPQAGAFLASARYLARQKQLEQQELERRRHLYTPGRPRICAGGRLAVVVDDGLATGATMVAALQAVRRQQPARLLCAVPVASPQGLKRVAPHADEVVCLAAPRNFAAVSLFYGSFPQLRDDEVISLLQTSTIRPA